jgi:hypothetical protein
MCVHFHKQYLSCVPTHESQGLRSGDRGGQFSGQENAPDAVSREAEDEHFEHLLQQ